jgi:hypothetical protein
MMFVKTALLIARAKLTHIKVYRLLINFAMFYIARRAAQRVYAVDEQAPAFFGC